MSYMFELQMGRGIPAYVISDGKDCEEAFAHLREQLGTEDEDEVVVLAVHTVH